MPTDSTDDDDEALVDRWADAEQPFGDPEESSLIPDIPSVTSYDTTEPDTEELTQNLSDVDSELLNTFAVCVLLTNLGVLLVSVGILLLIFRGRLQLGGGLTVVGGLALLRVWQYYRSFKRDRDSETDSDEVSESNGDSTDPDEPTDPGHNR